MKVKNEDLLIIFIRFIPIIFIITISLCLTYFISFEHYKNLENDRQKIKEEFILNNKNIVEMDIKTIETYIKNELSKSEDTLKKNIKSQVYSTHNIITSIYNSYKDIKTKEEIKELIKNALKNVRFNEGRGYFFIYELNGTNIFHPIKPEREGKNFFDAKDVNGTYIIRESIEIAKNKDKEGFQNWFFHKTDSIEKEYEKIGFIKKFEPYNWFIGTGEYVEDYKSIIKNKILNYISILKYIEGRYAFVIDYEGNVLVNKNKMYDKEEIFKTKRLSTFKDFISSTKKDMFVEYKVKDLNKNDHIKTSYLKKIDELDFVIATGFTLDIADIFIKNRIKELEEKYDNHLNIVFISAIIFTIIVLIITYFISRYFEKLFKKYRNTLDRKNLILNKAQSQAQIGSWEQTFDNNTLVWSDEVYRIFEIDINEDFSFEKFTQLVHPADRDSVFLSFQKSVEEHSEYYLEHRLLFSDGRIKYVIERGEHFYDNDNKHASTLGTVQDITERKESELLLEKSEEQYKSLMQQAPYSIEVFDINGFQIEVNKEHAKLWGFDTSKTLGTFNILTDEKFKDSGLLPYIKKAYSGEVVNIPPHRFDPIVSTTFTNGLGRSRLIRSQVYPVKDINNKVKNIIVTQIDVTAEEESKRNDEVLTSVFQVIPDLLFIMKDDGKIVDYRAQEDSDLYVEPKVFLGNMMQDVLPGYIGNLFDKNIKSLSNESDLKIFKYELKVNGKIKHFEARMAKLPLNEHIMTIIRDITEQTTYEQKLTFQSLLLEQSLSATDVVDENGLFTYVNDAYVKMWGYSSKDEILGTSPDSHCDDPEMPRTIIEKVKKDGEETFQFKARKKDGTTFDALMAVRSVYLMDKRVFIASTMDITEKEKLSKQYEAIFKSSKEGIFLTELNGTIIDVNPYLETLQNVSKDKIIGRNFADCFFDEDKKTFEKLNKKLLEKGFISFEMELRKIDGSAFFASIQSHVFELEGKKIIQGILRDLTIENENKLLIDRSKKIFDNIQEGVMITSSDGYITEVNKAFETITKYSSSEVIGKKASILRSGKQDDAFYEKMWDSLKTKNRWSGNIYNKKKSGEVYTSFLTISAIKNSKGEFQHYIGIFTDISNVLEYEKNLHEKDILLIQQSKMAAMGEMIDNIAHQWKQPLSLISMSNSLIKLNNEDEPFSTEEELDVAIENIESAVKHMASTIDDFRNFFMSDKSKKEFYLENCINRLFILVSSKLNNRDITIIKNINNSKIISIENELVQVLVNIVTNAIDALSNCREDKELIFIDTHEEKDNIVVSIKDNAGGVPEDVADKIFESRFTTKEKDNGTGIGLYMSTNIINSLGGTIKFKNVNYEFEGKDYNGADFIVTFPKS